MSTLFSSLVIIVIAHLTCVTVHVQTHDDYFNASIEQDRQAARMINSETNFKPGSSCQCDLDTLNCDCTHDGQRLHRVPVLSVALAYGDLIGKPLPATRQLQSAYPVDLTGRHPLLGVLRGSEHPFRNQARDRRPSAIDQIGTRFDLSDFRSSTPIPLNYLDLIGLRALPTYDQVFFFVHGWRNNSTRHLSTRDALLRLRRFRRPAVVMVDWRNGAMAALSGNCLLPDCLYIVPALNTGVVGRELGLLVHLLVQNGKVSPANVHLIGFSLGSHVIHYAANWFTVLQLPTNQCRQRVVGRLTALDPAAAQFQQFDGSYASPGDATFVDAVHTSSVRGSGGIVDAFRFLYGMSIAIGHLDMFLNSGRQQPNCGAFDVSCDHMRAYELFTFALDENLDARPRLGANCECHEHLSFCQDFEADEFEGVTVFGLSDIEHPTRGVVYVDWDFVRPPRPRPRPVGTVLPDTVPCSTSYSTAPRVRNEDVNFYVRQCRSGIFLIK